MHRVSPNATQHCGFAESLSTLSEPGPDGVVGPRPWPRSMLRRSAAARNTMGDTFRLPTKPSAWAFAPDARRQFLARNRPSGASRLGLRALAHLSRKPPCGQRVDSLRRPLWGPLLPGSGRLCPGPLDGTNAVLRTPSGQRDGAARRDGAACSVAGAGPVPCRTQLFSFQSLPKEQLRLRSDNRSLLMRTASASPIARRPWPGWPALALPLWAPTPGPRSTGSTEHGRPIGKCALDSS